MSCDNKSLINQLKPKLMYIVQEPGTIYVKQYQATGL